MIKERIRCDILRLVAVYINKNTAQEKHHNFKLVFDVVLADGTKTIADWTCFYKMGKSMDYATSIMHALQPDKNQGKPEELFLEDSNIDFKSYFKNLPCAGEVEKDTYKEKDRYSIKDFTFSHKVKTIQDLGFNFSSPPPAEKKEKSESNNSGDEIPF